MKKLKFTCKADIEEYDEVSNGEIRLEINFYKQNKKDDSYIMNIDINDHSIDLMDQRTVKNPYQIFCDHIGYNELHFKNHLIKHFKCIFKWSKIYVPENELENLINKLESFQVS